MPAPLLRMFNCAVVLVVCTVMDTIRFPFPDGYDGRCLIEPVITRYHNTGREPELKANPTLLESERKLFNSGKETAEGRFVWCGVGISNLHREARAITPAAKIVEELVRVTNTALSARLNERF